MGTNKKQSMYIGSVTISGQSFYRLGDEYVRNIDNSMLCSELFMNYMDLTVFPDLSYFERVHYVSCNTVDCVTWGVALPDTVRFIDFTSCNIDTPPTPNAANIYYYSINTCPNVTTSPIFNLCPNLRTIIFAGCSALSTVGAIVSCDNLAQIDFSGCAIVNSTDIDIILSNIAANAGTYNILNGTLDLSGGTNAAPSAGNTDTNYLYLISQGWTVNINP